MMAGTIAPISIRPKKKFTAPKLHFDNLKEKVIDQDLCVRCGACVGVCPVDCLDMKGPTEGWPRLIPEIPCISCGLCTAVCPVIEVPYDDLSMDIFGRVRRPDEEFAIVEDVYIGKSSTPEIFARGAAGGLVSALLEYMLDKGIVDGILTGGMNKDRPWETEPRIVRTKEEIAETANSHYTTIPTVSLLGIIRNTKERFALVGLGCQVSAVRKMQSWSPKYRERIPVVIGILCGSNHNPSATLQLLKDMNVQDPEREVAFFNHRGSEQYGRLGGGAVAILQDGNERRMGRSFGLNMWRLDPIYGCEGCCTCIDYHAELADISVADHKASQGLSQIYSRTSLGGEILRGAIAAGYLDAQKFDYMNDPDRTPIHRFIERVKMRRSLSVIEDRRNRGLPYPRYGGRELQSPDAYWSHPLHKKVFLFTRRILNRVRPLYAQIFDHLSLKVQYWLGTMYMGREIGRPWLLQRSKDFFTRNINPAQEHANKRRALPD